MPSRLPLSTAIDELEKFHGRPNAPAFAGPLEMILWENVVYLAEDGKRQAAFELLRDKIGLTADKIVAASDKALLAVTRTAGILPNNQVRKLRQIARTVGDDFGGDLDQILRQPLAQAKKSLRKFPGIGEPGTDKILLFCRALPVLALESNGLRVLLRLGFGKEDPNYAKSYRSAQEAVKKELNTDFGWLIRAHQLLRQHGQEICKRTRPICGECPLAKCCKFYLAQSSNRP